MKYLDLITEHISVLKTVLSTFPPCREMSLAITKLEECYHWVREAVENADKKHQDQIIADAMKIKEKETTQC